MELFICPHLPSDWPGPSLVASAKSRTWIYRYRSPIDQKVRQVRIGRWPAVSERGACDQWQQLADDRQKGSDPVLAEKLKRAGSAAAPSAEYLA
ncbi:Arm DNA-binding domain-containing protein [Alicycliphilus denitrificans]|uniref:Arm DNA-binding domain-containing protein n=1 Tax=Alicycliphilus denitrificans TaxID=179636 RepID=UPI003A812988